MKFVKYCVAALIATASADVPPPTTSGDREASTSLGNHKMIEQLVTVPIDEKRAMTLKVSPTFKLDDVESVTLKSFRKIVGYDTFESIRKAQRDERKDISDYYNVTVSMLVRRKPEDTAPPPKFDIYNPHGTQHLGQTLDKGFPYDDQNQYV